MIDERSMIAPAAIVARADDLATLISAASAEHEAGLLAERTSLDHYRRAGESLLKAKAAAKHGEWLPALERARIPQQRASEYMRLAGGWDKLPPGGSFALKEALRLIDDAGKPSLAEVQSCRVPMPALRADMCYMAHNDAQLIPGVPVFKAMEIVPTEQEGYWRYALLYLIAPAISGSDAEPDGYIDYNVRGIALNRPHVWESLTKDFDPPGDWWEYSKSLHGPICEELGDEKARKIRMTKITGGRRGQRQASAAEAIAGPSEAENGLPATP